MHYPEKEKCMLMQDVGRNICVARDLARIVMRISVTVQSVQLEHIHGIKFTFKLKTLSWLFFPLPQKATKKVMSGTVDEANASSKGFNSVMIRLLRYDLLLKVQSVVQFWTKNSNHKIETCRCRSQIDGQVQTARY